MQVVQNNLPFQNKQYYVLDGGFSTQLAKYVPGVDDDPLWTGRSLVLEKQAVVRVHRDFLSNGARVILTNSYQVSKESFSKYLGLTAEKTYKAIVDSAKLAWEAVHAEGGVPGHILVGGSVGPYGACQHDGSEYTGSYLLGDGALTQEQLIEWHKLRIDALEEGGVSFIAIESMPSSREALAVMDCLLQSGMLSGWVSFILRDEQTLAGGESIQEAVKNVVNHQLAKLGRLVAVGINCSPPKVISGALLNARSVAGKLPFVVYPNSGEEWDGIKRVWSGEGGKWIEHIPDWVKLGTTIVGGCCRVNAEDLSAVRNQIFKGLARHSR